MSDTTDKTHGDEVESISLLAEIGQAEAMMTYSPLGEEDQRDFDEPTSTITIIAPTRLLARVCDELAGC